MKKQRRLKAFISSGLVILLQSGWVIAEANDTPQVNESDKEPVVTVISSRGLISYVGATGTKNDMPIIEMPMSLSVLTAQRITDLGAETIQDALGYVAGVYNGPFGVDTRGDWSVVRGVSPVQYLDGMKMLYGYYNNTRPNPYSLNQIEILKGPASVLYGQGTTGGIVNLVSKKPQSVSQGEFWGQVGNFDRTQLAADYTGSLNSDESVLYRVTGMYRDSGTQTDFVVDDTLYFSPSFTWFASDDTEVTFLANIQKNESGSSTQFFPHVGTILAAPFGQIPPSRFVSEADFDRYDTEQKSLTAIVRHDLSHTWRFRISARIMDSEADYRTMYGWPPIFQADNRSLLRSFYVSDATASSANLDVRFHANFDIGMTEHDIVIGYDYQKAKTDNNSLFAFNQGGLIDVYSPIYNSIVIPSIENLPINDNPSTKTNQSGLYLQDQMKFNDEWIVSLGIRHDEAEVQTVGAQALDYSATTGRLGLMYVLENGLSPYVNYSESFDVIAGSTSAGEAYKPKRGEQKEFGLKFQPEGTEHLITASYFDIVEQNRLVPDLANPAEQIQKGEISIDGFEIEAQLEWKHTDVYASYSKTETEDEFGQALNSIPDQMFSTWITHRPEIFLTGFKIGAGARYVGKTDFLINGNMPYHTESYTLIDFMLGYETEQYDFSINVDNLADKTTVTTCLNRGDCFYGQLRTITANIRYKF